MDGLNQSKPQFLLSAELMDSKYQGDSKPLLTVVNILGNIKSKRLIGERENKRSKSELKKASLTPAKKVVRPQTALVRGNTKPKFQYQTKSMQNNRFVQELIDQIRYEKKTDKKLSSPKKNYLEVCQGKQAIKTKDIELKVVGFESSLSPRAKPRQGRFTTSYQMFSVAGLKGTE